MRIRNDIALVASGRLGMYLTDAYDCNVYLVDCGDQLALIDSGAGRNIDALLDCVRAAGYDPAAIRHILLTHAHGDHAGGCAELQRRLGASIWGSALTAQWVSTGDEHAISLDVARAAGGYPSDYHFQSCPVEHIVVDSEPCVIGRRTFLPIATPGHADDHIAYLIREPGFTALFAGDVLVCGGQVLLQYTYDCRPAQLGHSLLRLADLDIDALFPGHLHFCLHEGQAHIESAVSCLRRLMLPRSV